MIKKLLKEDLKKMTKILVYIYCISIVMAVLTKLIGLGNHIQLISILGNVFSAISYSAIASILVNTFIHILRVFINNFYKDESYLTHTLPVTKKQLLVSKYLASLITVVCSVAVSFLCLFILLYTPELMQNLKMLLAYIVSGLNISSGLFLTIFIVIVFAEMFSIISMSLCAIVKANTYNTKRLVRGIVWFGIYYFCSTVASIIAMVISFALTGNITQLLATQLSQTAFLTVLITGLIIYLGSAIVFYFICKRLFNKGVNVD